MFTELSGNIWNFTNDTKVITTNCIVKHNGMAVMGKGLALQASRNYPNLAMRHGSYLRSTKEINCAYYPDYNLIMFPTKYGWRDRAADYELINKSMKQLYDICIKNDIERVVMPRVGCGEGKLNWEKVKFMILNILNLPDVEFVVVSK